MLDVQGITVAYGRTVVLRDISLGVAPGEVVAIVGANGVGKSTLARTIIGLTHPLAGKISFLGQDITTRSPHEVVEMGITLVPEGRRVFPNFTVRENLLMGGGTKRAKERLERNLEEMLELFPILRERFHQKAGSLSGGEQQMLAIARGLMANPQLIILDEPSLGLAPLIVRHIFNLINVINERGISIILIEQRVGESLRVASRGYVFERGRISLAGSGEELLNNPEVRRAYIGR